MIGGARRLVLAVGGVGTRHPSACLPFTPAAAAPTLTFSNARLLSVSSVHNSDGSGNQGSRRSRMYKLALASGAAVGTGYALFDAYRKQNQGPERSSGSEHSAEDYLLAARPPSHRVARSVHNPADSTGLKVTLFQYQTCPFCCKARAFLDYFGLSYDVVEVNSVLRTQVKWSDYKKVPILVVETPDGKVFQLIDSSMIVSAVYSLLWNRKKGGAKADGADLLRVLESYPKTMGKDDSGRARVEVMNKFFLMYYDADVKKATGRDVKEITAERKWRQWVDSDLVHKLR